MALQESWHIRSRSRACAATERAFDDGEAIMTALFPDPESSGYLRKDFCLDAWKARTDEDEKLAPFRIDLGPRIFRGLSARPHSTGIARS